MQSAKNIVRTTAYLCRKSRRKGRRGIGMLNSIWAVLILLAVLGAAVTGNLTVLSKAAADGAQSAVETALLLTGAMCLWLGLMNIASHAGLTEKLSHCLSPLICRLFPEYAAHRAVGEKISMNIAANMLGMGNAPPYFYKINANSPKTA